MIPIRNTFLPGEWETTIDVNDFVNLNKKPFLNHYDFINTEEMFFDINSSLDRYVKEKEVLPFKESLFSIKSIFKELEELNFDHKEFKFTFSKGKTFKDLFNEVSSTALRNSIKMGLIKRDFSNEIPPLFFPDVRQVPLYGIDGIIKSKKSILKKMNKGFQTEDWIEKRIEYNRQIDLLTKFRKHTGKSVNKPASNSVEVLDYLLRTTIYTIGENPNVTFHLPSLIHFIDIYLEKEISVNKITETEALRIVGEFYAKLLFIHYFLQTKNINFLIIETIFSAEPTKTTYRFLQFYQTLKEYSFPITVVSHNETPIGLIKIYDQLIKAKLPIRFVTRGSLPVKQNFSLSHLGFPYNSEEDIILYNKHCDALKVFFITLNGGKDIDSNLNLHPVYQKIKNDNFTYEDFLQRFKDTLINVFTIYSEANNLIMYLSEKYFSHSMRSSLKKEINDYYYYFDFLNIDMLAAYLLAVKHQAFKIKRNKKGFVVSFDVTEKFDDERMSEMIGTIKEIFLTEAQRVPFYKYGHQMLNFHIHKKLDENEYFPYDLKGDQGDKYKYIVDNVLNVEDYRTVLRLANKNIRDVRI